MAKVLVSDTLSPRAVDIFGERGIQADVRTGLDEAELRRIVADFDGLAVRSATKVTAAVIEAATNLTVIGRAGVGVDNIDLAAASQRGIVVMNAPFGNAITTAEHTIAMLFAVARQIPAADHSTRAGKWEKSRFLGIELHGKTLGVIGAGNIGSIVVERALGLGMRVVAFDPFLTVERAADLGVDKVELDELFARADFITLHTPLNEQTRGIIDRAAFAKMKPGVYIVNCARGGLVVEANLKAAIESGQVAGAALDVFVEEPAHDNPLFALPQVVVTPHLGAATAEAQEKVAVQIAEQMSDYLLFGAVTNAVNVPSMSAEEAVKLGPYMQLAQQLGSFIGQVTESGITKVVIEFEGQVTNLSTRPLSAVALQGLLSHQLDSVNMVNAPILAKDRNIDISEVLHDRAGNYQTLVRLKVTTEKRVREVAGTLFSDEHPRIVEVNGIAVEAELLPHMLFLANADRPGFIGRLGTALGDAGVNIATFHLGRNAQGGEALALIALDEAIPESVLAKVQRLPDVKEAKALSF